MSLQEDSLNHEADRVAESTLTAFTEIIAFLDESRQLRAAKRLLWHTRTLVERLEKDLCRPSLRES